MCSGGISRDVIYWMTDMGWMMGPWLVFGGLLLGATVFLYDGAPDSLPRTVHGSWSKNTASIKWASRRL
jgi:acyl-coenzyme A synthetase/AMP-(fatty) acid ligase